MTGQDEVSYRENFRYEKDLTVDGDLQVDGQILGRGWESDQYRWRIGGDGLTQAQVDARVRRWR